MSTWMTPVPSLICTQCLNLSPASSREECGDKTEKFLSRCFYHSGQYDSLESFAELDKRLVNLEVRRKHTGAYLGGILNTSCCRIVLMKGTSPSQRSDRYGATFAKLYKRLTGEEICKETHTFWEETHAPLTAEPLLLSGCISHSWRGNTPGV